MKRYNIDWDKTERYEYKNGEYVFYEDHRKEIERLRKALKFYGEHLDGCCYGSAKVTSDNFVANKVVIVDSSKH